MALDGMDRRRCRYRRAGRLRRRRPARARFAAHHDLPAGATGVAVAGPSRASLWPRTCLDHAAAIRCRARDIGSRRAGRPRCPGCRSRSMIRFEAVTITYADAEEPALRDVDLA